MLDGFVSGKEATDSLDAGDLADAECLCGDPVGCVFILGKLDDLLKRFFHFGFEFGEDFFFSQYRPVSR